MTRAELKRASRVKRSQSRLRALRKAKDIHKVYYMGKRLIG